ncbi:MAG TPA: FkbM family methyltransferase [Gemmatimonadales bacterium]|nr:FkbM family methyltransferase [Gemmatimonadales bacterium]
MRGEREVYGLTFQYRNAPEFELLAHEIFEGGEYDFPCSTDAPVILDCGSHIGLSVAWFKRRFPRARITAFEPDPRNFELLQANVAANGLQEVELLNVALAAERGTARFYGQFKAEEPMSSSHSLMEDWGTQRTKSWILVQTVPLSDYITGPVDYLKLDIEGMETEVLRSIASRLHLVKALGLEFHGTGDAAESGEEEILRLLRQSGFELAISRKPRDIFPSEIDGWVSRVHPYMSVIKATRPDPPAAQITGTPRS